MPIYALTIFVSAFLLFQVEPVIARIILPWFGGSAAVWTVCLLFFQVVLLLGYGYAHWSIRALRPAVQTKVHVGLLALSLLCLPILPAPGWKPHGAEEPTGRILLLLLVTVGLPYFLLSTTGPLLQAWYARRRPTAGDDAPHPFPYRLYALSNFGSMLALLSYPALVEPWLTIRQQAVGWSVAYLVFVLLCGMVAVQAGREARSGHSVVEGQPDHWQGAVAPGIGSYLLWTALAACSSVLLLAITTHLSQNVAAIPFLWVLPLSLYLLSFIVCFGARTWQWRPAFLPLPAIAIAGMVYSMFWDPNDLGILPLIVLFSAGLFLCCVVCHGELARLKPHPRYLTGYYLTMSLGGALGGLFVGLLAPHIFSAYYELPIGLAGCTLLALFVLYRDPDQPLWDPAWLALAAMSAAMFVGLWFHLRVDVQHNRALVRNFYGALWVFDSDDPKAADATRSLTHGTILHGEQYLNPERHMQPITYYGLESGIGLALREGQQHGPERVGVIGLGTGTVAAYGRPGDFCEYYEINPLVEQLARTQFSFLRDSKAQVKVIMGDARLMLESQPPQNFDVLAVDAFSSDAIPVHLLTREAFQLYFRHLKPGGVLVVHVSNRFLDLEPVVAQLSDSLGKECRAIETDEDADKDLIAADWVLVTARRSLFDTPLLKNAGRAVSRRKHLRLWTDDYSNLFQILKR
jgi:SAM-dependent methyltransferase